MSKSILRAARCRALASVVEMLESRRLLTVVALTGTSGNDNFTISYDSGSQEYSFSGGTNVPSPIDAADFEGFTLTGGGGADTLDVQGGSPLLLNDAGGDGTELSITVETGTSLGIAVGEHLASLSIGATSSVQVRQGGFNTLILNSLTIAGTTNAWTGSLDLADNDLIVHGGTLATITNQIASGYNAANSGYWDGTGITSSTAASDSTRLTALGVALNGQGSGMFYSSFDGEAVGPTDVLVKYTYYGDANLDGQVNGSDYSLIDNGYNVGLTGWSNGDFNYDGHVNGGDYALIDNAFNAQGTRALHQQITFSVPNTVEIDLSWSASADSSVYAYNIYRSTTPNFTPDDSTLIDQEEIATQYFDVGLTAGTSYYYTVTALHIGGSESSYINSEAQTTLATDPDLPVQPTDLSAVADSDTDMELQWTDAGDNATGYVIQQFDGTNWQTVDIAPARSQADRIRSLSPNTTYTFRVTAVNSSSPTVPSIAVPLGALPAGATTTGPTTTQTTNPSTPYDGVVFIFGGFGETNEWLNQGNGQGVGQLAKELRAKDSTLKVTLLADDECGTGDGSGAPMNEFMFDYNTLGIKKYAIVGYSQGGGIAFNFSKAINNYLTPTQRQTNFALFYTSYIDAVERPPTEVSKKLWPTIKNRPLLTLHNENYYEQNSEPGPHGQALIDDRSGDVDQQVKVDDQQKNIYHTTIDKKASLLDTITNNLERDYLANPLP